MREPSWKYCWNMVGKVRGTDFRYTYEVGGEGGGVESEDSDSGR